MYPPTNKASSFINISLIQFSLSLFESSIDCPDFFFFFFFFSLQFTICIRYFIMLFLKLFLLFSLCSFTFSHDADFNPHLLPRPLIIQPEDIETQYEKFDDDLNLHCTSWRFSVEANNLSPWKTIPEECLGYVKEYMTGRGYKLDLERVSSEAGVYAKNLELSGDGKDVWIFDIDETLLSNLPYYIEHGYGLEIFDPIEFDKWVQKGMAPAIEPSLKLYEKILDLGFKVFLLTGRNEKLKSSTIENLTKAGFRRWDKLILRDSEQHGKLAVVFKSEKRGDMVEEGYRIVGNSGDQWSDLLGADPSRRSFKLPNPMYYIP
ncbi:hypothetical protein Goari_015706 [Gossypium aridum]|uniref:Acid phosphatase n=1 Tax=Gossypium aridum TaxID=34290 RepID=A0A7J8WHF8_GOSAI|nr:hypothetical protein [Gossypium aridum]